VVFDTVGGDTQTKSFGVLRKGGLLVSIVNPPDASIAQQHGVVAKYAFVIPNGARLQEIAGLVDAGKLKVIIEKEFPLSQAKARLRKILVKLFEPEARSYCGSLDARSPISTKVMSTKSQKRGG
jgi:NADPH:quinone reductase-like Zn-dependent oxidoreductase